MCVDKVTGAFNLPFFLGEPELVRQIAECLTSAGFEGEDTIASAYVHDDVYNLMELSLMFLPCFPQADQTLGGLYRFIDLEDYKELYTPLWCLFDKARKNPKKYARSDDQNLFLTESIRKYDAFLLREKSSRERASVASKKILMRLSNEPGFANRMKVDIYETYFDWSCTGNRKN
jgi:hypothetical protein